ncbi:MAG: A/G-specific adenine glycosylase [Bacteroidota bacterium]
MDISSQQTRFFTRTLTGWHQRANFRELPWKNEKDPYRIWLSEVILQQTRALQGLPYYLAFTAKYPTVQHMAAADEQEAFRLWQGLGYYNRCKNMLATARTVTAEHGGVFPSSYTDLLGLKGIGPYTAAAIASFAYGLPHAVVDGNVYRVLSRFFGIDTPFDTTAGKKQFAVLAQQLLHTADSAAHNQAIMDLGATVCVPRKPLCDICPLQKKCFAYQHGAIDMLPVRSKKIVVKKRFFNYLLLQYRDTLWIHKRTGNDIWENLHEPFLIETTEPLTINTLHVHHLFKDLQLGNAEISYSGAQSQRLTHQLIQTHVFTVRLASKPKSLSANGLWLDAEGLKKTAFPKTVVSFLKNYLYF